MDGQQSGPKNPTDVPYNDAVVRLIAEARDESLRHQHEYVGTEHLVLALSGPAGNDGILRDLAVDPTHIYAQLSTIIQSGAVAPNANLDRPFTSRTQTALRLAAASAQQLGHTHIAVPHVLLGLLQEQRNIGAQVLV